MTINELKLMNETDRILWFTSAKAKDLSLVLKNEGIKGISKMKKAEKLEMIVGMVVENTVEDEKIEKIIDDTKRLTEEINARQSFKEEIEQTLCARWLAKEITWEEFKQTITKYNISIPINVADKEYTKESINRNIDLYSNYEHFDKDNKYYSVLNKDFEWNNVFRIVGKYSWYDWTLKEMYERNTVDEDWIHQLAFDFDEDGEYVLLVYKNYELLGAYVNGSIDDIKRLAAYDDRLVDEDVSSYSELLELLEKQYKEYDKIVDADMMMRKKLKSIKKYEKFIKDKINLKETILSIKKI